jgi:hypothetical protein
MSGMDGVQGVQGAAGGIAGDSVAIAELLVEWGLLSVEERLARWALAARRRHEGDESQPGRAAAARPDVRASAVRARATCHAAAVGAIAALPMTPWLGIAASAAEAGVLWAIEGRALAEMGLVDTRPGAVRPVVRTTAQKALTAGAGWAVRSAGRELGVALPRLAAQVALGVAHPAIAVAWGAGWNAIDMYRRLSPAVAGTLAARPSAPAVEMPRGWGPVTVRTQAASVLAA